ncbi:hypothetical protein [Mycolicibacterium aubagnense]|uniref:hypothetical protein n=1 Tax=Mycolicibacterium aubagnense TaxID=319707 RepID=UPI001F2F54DC|nr:hypothetical protein [Mycolicibacterium aubagnense]
MGALFCGGSEKGRSGSCSSCRCENKTRITSQVSNAPTQISSRRRTSFHVSLPSNEPGSGKGAEALAVRGRRRDATKAIATMITETMSRVSMPT